MMWHVELLLTVTSAVPEYLDPSKFVPATVYLPPTSAAVTTLVNIMNRADAATQCLKLMEILRINSGNEALKSVTFKERVNC
jgi:hypothetical protein